MNLTDLVNVDQIIMEVRARTKLDVLKELSTFSATRKLVPDSERMYRGLVEREDIISTGIGEGVAIPHTRFPGPENQFLIVARSTPGIDYDSLDGEPAHLFIVLIGPEEVDEQQLKMLSRTARLLKVPEFRHKLMTAEKPEAIMEIIRQEEALIS
jgi:mannitol/fructose-specific phosphotransferase system IIA component (Ntr-type)